MKTIRTLRAFTVSAVVMLIAISCGSSADSELAAVDGEQSVMGLIRASNVGFDRATPVYESVAEAMPNRTFIIDDGPQHAIADLFVAGPVLRVTEGVGLNWTFDERENTEQRIVLPFGDPEAIINTVHVTVRADSRVTDGLVADPGDEVTFGLAFSGLFSLMAMREELVDHPGVAVLLYEPSPFDYAEGLWGVLEDGGLLGVVNDKGM